MPAQTLTYDLVCSLGANCSTAHNLRYRGMRHFSLPFDWCYVEDNTPFLYLSKGFKNGFSDFFLKENLVKTPSSKEHAVIYKDKVSNYLFPNHFPDYFENNDELYETVAKKMRRRIDRLFTLIARSETILFVIAGDKAFDINCIRDLSSVLSSMYPSKKLDFRVMQFGAEQNEEIKYDNIHIFYYTRPHNTYDFSHTNFEWAFLDGIKLGKVSISPEFSSGSPLIDTNRKWRLLSFKIFKKRFKLELFMSSSKR